MTRREYVKNAWVAIGADWDKIEADVLEYGHFIGDTDLIPDHVYDQCVLLTVRVPQGFRGKPESFTTSGERPKSLKGIEDNNGWTKLENERDLPSEAGKYEFISIIGSSYSKEYFTNDPQCLGYYTRLFSHWRPIIMDRPPLY